MNNVHRLGLIAFVFALLLGGLPALTHSQGTASADPGLEKAIATAQVAVEKLCGPARFQGGEAYFDLAGKVNVFALEFQLTKQNQPVTVFAGAAPETAGVLEVRLGAPPQKDPAALARAAAAIEARYGLKVEAPRSIIWRGAEDIWAWYAERSPLTGETILCNLLNGRIGLVGEGDQEINEVSPASNAVLAVTGSPAVTYPTAAGIVMMVGRSYTFRWRNFTGANVKIALYKGDQYLRTVVASTPNDGIYTWRIPSTVPSGETMRIRIISTTNSRQYARSANMFSILKPQVTSPNSSGTAWMPGRAYAIRWMGFPGTYVRIVLYKGTTAIRTIAASARNTGQYNWVIPANMTYGNNYKIRINATSNTAFADYSNEAFELAPSFAPIEARTATGAPTAAWWKYRINDGRPVDVSFNEDVSLDLSFRLSDLTLNVNRTTWKRTGSFNGTVSGSGDYTVSGTYSASSIEDLQPSTAATLIKAQHETMNMLLSAGGLGISAALNLNITGLTPPAEWFLDRCDLDQYPEGYVYNEQGGYVHGDISGSLVITFLGTTTYYGNVESAERWTIVRKLPSMTVQGHTYYNIVEVDRETVVPGFTDGADDVTLTYWVARGVGMIKGNGQFQVLNEPLGIELIDTNLPH